MQARSPVQTGALILFSFVLWSCQPGTGETTGKPGAGGNGAGSGAGSGGTAGANAAGSGAATGGSVGSGSGGMGARTGGAGGAAGGTAGTTDPGPTGMGGTAGAGSGDAGLPAERPAAPGGPAKIVLVASGLPGTFGVAVDPVTGDIYSADHDDNRVRRVSADGKSTVVMGPGADGAGGQVSFSRPHHLMFQPKSRNLFVADTMAGRVVRMKVDTGAVDVLAGGGGKIPGGGNVYSLAFDSAGKTLYFTANGGIRVVDLETDTLKSTINFGPPRVIAVDSKGTIYVARGGANTLQTLNAQGQASNVPGGGPINAPKGLAIDHQDNVIVVDTESHTIARYDVTTKTLTRIVGNGQRGTGTLGGSPLMAQTSRPHGAVVDAMGRILISDSFNDRIIAVEY